MPHKLGILLARKCTTKQQLKVLSERSDNVADVDRFESERFDEVFTLDS